MSSPGTAGREKSKKSGLGRVASRRALQQLLKHTSATVLGESKKSPKRTPSASRRQRATEHKAIPHDAMKSASNSDAGDASQKSMRFRIVQEIKDSERTYVTAMHTAIMLFLEPLEKSLDQARARGARAKALSLTHTSSILSENSVDAIFSNIREVASVATDLLQDLEVATHKRTFSASSTIGDFFIKLLQDQEFTKAYTTYIESYGTRLETLSGTLPSSFTAFRLQQEATSHCGNHTLSSFLVQPVQRIPRYVLLLRDLRKHTEPDHPDYPLLTKAMEDMEAFTARLDAARQQSQDRSELLKQLENMSSKERSALDLNDRQIIASGPIDVRDQPGGESKPLFLILFNDCLICCKRSTRSTKLLWQMKLANCKFSKSGRLILLSELRSKDEYPYTHEIARYLEPHSSPPYDMGFWYNNLETAVGTFWFDPGMLLESSSKFSQSMRERLLTDRDIAFLQMGSPKKVFSKGEVVINEGMPNTTMYLIISGEVTVQKGHAVSGKVQVLTTMGAGEFMGEFAYLKPPGTRIAEATVIASSEDPAILCCMSMDTLDQVFLSNTALSLRFYKLQACVLANRFTLQHITRIRRDNLLFARKQSLASAQDMLCGYTSETTSEPSEEIGVIMDDEIRAMINHQSTTAGDANAALDVVEAMEGVTLSAEWLSSMTDDSSDDSDDVRQDWAHSGSLLDDLLPDDDSSEDNTASHVERKSSIPLYPSSRRQSADNNVPEALRRHMRRKGSMHNQLALAKDKYPAVAKVVPSSERLLEEFRCTIGGPGLPERRRARLLILENYVALCSKAFLKVVTIALHSHEITSVIVKADDQSTVILATENLNIYTLGFDGGPTARSACTLVERLVGSAEAADRQQPSLDMWSSMDLTAADWKKLMTVGQQEIFKNGTEIIAYRKPVQYLYHLQQGSCMAYVNVTGDSSPLGEEVDEGEVLGEITFLQGGVATATVAVSSETATLLTFERKLLFQLLEENPDLGARFYRLLSLFMAERFLSIQSELLVC